MRISDWSSDVCSSDLNTARAKRSRRFAKSQIRSKALNQPCWMRVFLRKNSNLSKRKSGRSSPTQPISRNPLLNRICLNSLPTCWWSNIDGDRIEDAGTLSDDGGRHACQVSSEEHKSEL